MIATAIETNDEEFVTTCDRHIQSAIMTVLGSSKYIALRRLSCQVRDGVVELSGTVSSFYLKQLAQAAVLQIHRGGGLRNLVEVQGESPILVATQCGPTQCAPTLRGPAQCSGA